MKKDYMTRLERAARWRLPPQEAEDVISDYREIVGDPPRSEEELLRDLGKTQDAIRSLVQPRQYYIWLAVFCIMSFCVLALSFSQYEWRFWLIYFEDYFYGTGDSLSRVVTVLGAVTALVWFRWHGRKGAQLPKAIPILLAVFLAFAAGVVLFYGIAFRNLDVILRIWDETLAAWFPCEGPFVLAADVTCYSCLLIALSGVYSLIRARTGDRRWAAVYVLAMAAALILRMVLEWAHTMYTSLDEAAYRQFILQWAVAAAGGLIGTGVALC